MTAPATEWREENGMLVLYMGMIPVGRVCNRNGSGQPSWLFNLDYMHAFWRRERTTEACKAAVETRFTHWLRQAGLSA